MVAGRPPCRISWLPTTWTGLMLVRFGYGMREPVTTISETSAEAPASAAIAWVAERPSRAAPQIIEDAIRRSRMELIFKVFIPPAVGGHQMTRGPASQPGMSPRSEVAPG